MQDVHETELMSVEKSYQVQDVHEVALMHAEKSYQVQKVHKVELMHAEKSYRMQEVHETELMFFLVYAGNSVILSPYIPAMSADECPDTAQKMAKEDPLLILGFPFYYIQQIETPLPLDSI